MAGHNNWSFIVRREAARRAQRVKVWVTVTAEITAALSEV